MSGYTVDEAAMVVLYVAGSWWFLFLLFTFHSSIVTSNGTNIIYNHTFITFGSSLIFLVTLDGINVILGNTNITYDHIIIAFDIPYFSLIEWSNVTLDNTNIIYDHTIVTFGDSIIFLLMVDSANVRLGRTREEQFNFKITVIRRVEASQRIRFVL